MKITKSLLAAALAATTLSGVGFAFAQDATQTPPPPGPGRMADANQDGVVTREEITASVEQHFARVDTNGDGQITPEERQAMHQAMREQRQQRRAERAQNGAGDDAPRYGRRGHGGPGARHHGPGRGMMARMDADGDGIVTLAEAKEAALARFAMVDANNDGKIEQAERVAMRAKMRERMMQRRDRPCPQAGQTPPAPPADSANPDAQ